ncbi:MAG TPA: helix-turn-helix domain-containing protein, partial [Blastocatellia bacterium]|nr:helix-turn-helix domain-containing protein [Blastocatellia bacterium]
WRSHQSTSRRFAGQYPAFHKKVLTQQLRELVNDEIVQRQPHGAVPAPVEYSLTEYGRSLLPLVENVRIWGRDHMERIQAGVASDPSRQRRDAVRG